MLIATLFFTTCIQTLAQEYHVFCASGPVTLMGKTDSALAKRGQLISKGTRMSIGASARITLIEKNGHALVFENMGTYEFEQIREQFEKVDSKAIRFLSYVWEKFHSHKNDNMDQLSMRSLGGVSRSSKTNLIYPPDSTIILGDEVQFLWKAYGLKSCFTLLDNERKEFLKIYLPDSTFTMFANSSKLKRGEYYQWAITADPIQKISFTFHFLLPEKQWLENFRSEEAGIKKVLGTSLDAEDGKEILRLFYHLNHAVN